MTKIVSILGTRPEIVKFSPLLPLLDREFDHVVVHTGQHYDERMDRIFFDELQLRPPTHFLAVGSQSPSAQLAKILEGVEPILRREKPRMVLVLGDTNSALGGGIASAKAGVPLVHIESGCRSFNMSMAEEQNRVMLDHISEVLLAPDSQSVENLRREGISKQRIRLVGSTGLDAMARTLKLVSGDRLRKFDVAPDAYVLATIHRAENTDDPKRLRSLVDALNRVSRKIPVLFPVHPRTESRLKSARLRLESGIRRLPPLGNLDFVSLLKHSVFVMSDSGGVQEEAAVANRPCLILRDETEWTRLVEAGKNFLVGTDADKILKVASPLVASAAARKRVARKKAPLAYGAAAKILRILKGVQ